MNNRNTSDIIEAYLKKILESENIIEIRRAEMASQFNVVPSQINYVIKTRFTLAQGYQVESKRGGGGYIRIAKIRLNNKYQLLEQLADLIGTHLSEKEALSIVQKIYDEKLLTKEEGNIILAAVSRNVLSGFTDEESIRARIILGILERLSYQERE